MTEPMLLVAPDKLRGTLSAREAADALAEGADQRWRIDRCPLSDGGEGFAEVVAPPGAQVCTTMVTGPLGAPVEARWYLQGTLAVIESAQASGLVLAGGSGGNDPLGATSSGTGELVAAAINGGARRVLVGVGGSAMTDGGIGAVEALESAGWLKGAELLVACDVDARFSEAAALFGPQKGATPSQVEQLTLRLGRLARHYLERFGVDVSDLPGAGAAGGLGGGLAAMGGRLVSGFDLVARMVRLDERLLQAGLVMSAEGRLDRSSWTGKVVGELARRARRLGTDVIVIAGELGPGAVPDDAGAGLSVLDLTELFDGRARRDARGCLTEAARMALARR